ncbi:hypothetical protein V8F06_000267 [Rhypophila decipiens]
MERLSSSFNGTNQYPSHKISPTLFPIHMLYMLYMLCLCIVCCYYIIPTHEVMGPRSVSWKRPCLLNTTVPSAPFFFSFFPFFSSLHSPFISHEFISILDGRVDGWVPQYTTNRQEKPGCFCFLLSFLMCTSVRYISFWLLACSDGDTLPLPCLFLPTGYLTHIRCRTRGFFSGVLFSHRQTPYSC